MNKTLRENIRETIVAFKYGEIGCKEALDFIAEYITEDRKERSRTKQQRDQTTTGPNK